MTMQLLEALTILAAGNSGEINYHANDESFAIFQEARRTVGGEAQRYEDRRLFGPGCTPPMERKPLKFNKDFVGY